MRLKTEAKKMETAMEDLKKAYVEEMAKKAKETSSQDSGEVPFTLGDK